MNPPQDDSATVADAIRAEFSLGPTMARFVGGSLPVFAAGDGFVVKLFPADERSHFETESKALSLVDGSLSIPTPRLIATGQRGDWCFIVMTRLAGKPLADVWPSVPSDQRRELAHQVGTALAELHSIATDDWGPLAIDWPHFMRVQRETCFERQASKGLQAPWLDQVDEFLLRWFPPESGRRVLLHTEVMREHLLADIQDGTWRLTGLLDFEPAMAGAPEYEFASVGIFVACAEPGILRAVIDAYGMRADDDLPQRLMAYSLLHRYSNLRWYLERLPSDSGSATLESLARRWFASE